MPGDLTPLLHHVPAWLLVLFRLSGIFILAPVLGSLTIPVRVKVLLVFILSMCVYPMLLDTGRPSAGFIGLVLDHGLSLWTLVPLVFLELLVGYAVGFVASLPIFGMQMGAHVIDQQIGLGVAGVLNPELGEQSGPVGEMFFHLAMAIFVILGGHRLMLAILVGSFDHVPLGGFNEFEALILFVIGLLNVMVELAMKIAAPLLCLVFLETVAMGFIARTVPQLNILSVGFALRIVMGLAVLVGFVAVAAGVYVDSARRVLHEAAAFFGS